MVVSFIKPHHWRSDHVDNFQTPSTTRDWEQGCPPKCRKLVQFDKAAILRCHPTLSRMNAMEAVQPFSRQAIDELKEIHAMEYGSALSDAEAQELSARLLNLFALLLQSPEQGANN